MNFKKLALIAAMTPLIYACGSDDNNNDVSRLEAEIAQLQEQINNNATGSENGSTTSLEAELERRLAEIIALNPNYVGNLTLAQVNMVYSHNSYDTRQDRWPLTDIPTQLDAGVRVLELDLWDAEGTIAHDDNTINQHCSTIDACLNTISDWSANNPGHAPIVIQFEMTDNGEFVEETEEESLQLAARTDVVQAKIDLLAEKLAPLVEQDKLVAYGESLDSISQLRDKFVVTLYRKYNTPFYSDRSTGNFSKRQTIPLNTALELDQNSNSGNKYRNLLSDSRIFLASRYIGDESPDNWSFADPDYLGQAALEQHANLEGEMLRVLKQDGAAYTAEGFTDNTFMISNVSKSGDVNASIDSLANAVGTHKLDNIRQDVVARNTLESGILPHCERSERNTANLQHCQAEEVLQANRFNPEIKLRIAIMPDTQGRDDDWGKNKITLPDGSTTHVGMDYNKDGFFDGNGYQIDVSDSFNPVLVLDDDGNPIRISPDNPAERGDYPYDLKHLPFPLVEPMVQKIIAEDADMMLAIGDMTDYRTELEYVEWNRVVSSTLEEANIQVYAVRGNHEIVDGRDWTTWFSSEEEHGDRKSVDNVANNISVYDSSDFDKFDQGYKLYSHYVGALVKDELTSGKAVGYPGIEDLVYSFIEDNTLFVAIDTYASDLVSTSYQGTWSTFFPWVKELIEANKDKVDHIIVYGHESFSSKKRPHLYDYNEYNDYLAREQASQEDEVCTVDEETQEETCTQEPVVEPGLLGQDLGQLGYLEQQNESIPGIAEEVLSFFAKHKVLYLAGHDHQYSRSAIHSVKDDKTSDYFTQVIAGNASWKAYNNRYGENADYETQFAQDNHTNPNTDKTTKVSFAILEIADRQMNITNWYAEHSLTEDDMTRGAYWDSENNTWFKPTAFNEETGAMDFEQTPVVWQKGDTVTFTTDATKRLVNPLENYWSISKTPINQGYIGTEASILEGYNLTYNSHEIFRADASDFTDFNGDGTGEYLQTIPGNETIARRVDNLSEFVTLNWLADENDETVSDILFIDGTRNQDGTYDNTVGIAQTTSPSEFYFNKDGEKTTNPTLINRDGMIADEDKADAMAISITAPAKTKPEDLAKLTIGRFDETQGKWVPVLDEQCFTTTGYTDDFSVMYRKADGRDAEGPEGADFPASCAYQYWGYNYNVGSVWGFINTDGHFALIARPEQTMSAQP